MEKIWVTNETGQAIQVYWDGKKFYISTGGSTEIPVNVAQYFFAFGSDNKIPALTNLGWIKQASDISDALARLEKVVLSDEKLKDRRSVSLAAVPVPGPVIPMAGRGQRAALTK
jgi:hypothetical protein